MARGILNCMSNHRVWWQGGPVIRNILRVELKCHTNEIGFLGGFFCFFFFPSPMVMISV